MTRRIHSDVAAKYLSIVGLASGFWLLGKAAVEFFCVALSCGDDCNHIQAGEE